MPTPKHPMQPIIRTESGVARFHGNAIIDHLRKTGQLDLNALAVLDFSDEDRMQIAQLLGYSVSGFGDLSYASDEVVAEADRQVEELRAAAADAEEDAAEDAAEDDGGLETVQLTVTYDPALVSERFMAEHVLELEGVEGVRED